MTTSQTISGDNLSPELKQIATFAASYFFEHFKWPQVRDVLRQGFGDALEVEQCIQKLFGFLSGFIVGDIPNQDAKVGVNISMMAQLGLANAQQFALDYGEFVRICAKRYNQQNASMSLTSSELLASFLSANQSNERQGWLNTFIRLLYPFLQSGVEVPGMYRSLSGVDAIQWSMEIGDNVRYFVDVQTLPDYFTTRKMYLTRNQPHTMQHTRESGSTAVQGPVHTVFIVHGHDIPTRNAVEVVLRRMHLEVIILSESPYGGRFTLQKFEEEAAKANFAVILVTEDDLAVAQRDIPNVGDIPRSQLMARGRQNVIWEWGYLFQKLGTRRVCVLKAPGVEMFSDLWGRGYVELSNGWEERLQQEIAAANRDSSAGEEGRS